IDAHWTEVGSLNCDERGYPGIIRQADIYDLSSDPAYDIITCNDVIEHVHRPREALAKMASMLRPGGLLYLAIPNRLSIKHVLRDGHYHLFGLNLLEHYAARAYFDAYSSRFPGKSYSCGEMYPFEWYQHTLGGLGLSVERLPSQKIDAQKMKETFFECEERIRTRHQFAAVDEKLQETIIERFADYAGDFWRSLSLYQAKGAGEFIRDYADDFWTVICRKTR
ncbi:class I SAM-dependent methyltransferase, partial [Rhizobiaceae sp. 2RAB30]